MEGGIKQKLGINRLVIQWQQKIYIYFLATTKYLSHSGEFGENANEPSGASMAMLVGINRRLFNARSPNHPRATKITKNPTLSPCGRPIHDNKRETHATERRRDIGQLPRHLAQHAEPHVKSNDSRANGTFSPFFFILSFFPRLRHKFA